MKALSLNVFVDGYGWELSRRWPVFDDLLPYRYPLRSVLGYTNTALPTILTGSSPARHGAFGLFMKDRGSSPFRRAWWLRGIPPLGSPLGGLRRRIDRAVARRCSLDGWFTSGAIPHHRLHRYDYSEKSDIYRAGAFAGCATVIDEVHRRAVPSWIFDWRRSEEENVASLEREVRGGRVRWALLGLQGFDGLAHRHGILHEALGNKLLSYRRWVGRVLSAARGYDVVRASLFSDHGLADVRFVVDVRGALRRAGLREGKDVFVLLDATMARFHFLRPGAERDARDALGGICGGAFLEDAALERLGVLFEDRRYGDAIFLLEEGGLICPNDHARAPVRGMHGYHPDSPSMEAVVLLSHSAAPAPRRLQDLRDVLAMGATQDPGVVAGKVVAEP